MNTKNDAGPGFTLEELEQQDQRRAPDEDEGVTYDEELDEKRILDEAMQDQSDTLPSERPRENDTPEQRGSSRVDDEVRGRKRKAQYKGGADVVSEID
jgi:hypothetical protein